MFRIGLKFSGDNLYRVEKQYYSRVYLMARYFETQARLKCNAGGRPCKDVKDILRFCRRMYSVNPTKRLIDREERQERKTQIIMSIIGSVGLAIAMLASLNKEVRELTDSWFPDCSIDLNGPLTEANDFLTVITTPRKSLWQMMFEKKTDSDK